MTAAALSVEAVGVVGAGAVGQAVTTALISSARISSALSARLLITSRTHEQATALAADFDDMRTATNTAVRRRDIVRSPSGRTARDPIAVRRRRAHTVPP